MPELDYRLIQQAGQVANIPAAKERAYTLANSMDTQQLNKMKLAEAETQSADTEKVRNILKNSDLSTFEGQAKAASEATKINPTIGMELMKGFQAQRSGEADNTKSQYELMSAKNDVIGGAAVQLKMQHDQLAAQGKTEPEINAAMGPQMMATVQNLMSAKLPNGQPVLDDNDKRNLDSMMSSGVYNAQAIDSIVANSKQAREVLTQKISEQRADTEAKRAATYEQSVIQSGEHQKRQDEEASKKTNLAEKRLQVTKSAANSGFTPEEGELMGALAERGVSLPTGFRSKSQQIALLNGLVKRNAGKSPDEIADMIQNGQISFGSEKKLTSTAAGNAGKLAVAENEIKEYVPLALQASATVPRGSFVPWNSIKQKGLENISDPDLKRFYNLTETILNNYDVIAGRGGTDVAKRERVRKMLSTADSPEAYKSALNVIMLEADVAGRAARKAAGIDSTPPAAGSTAAPPQSAPAAGGAGMGAAPQAGQSFKHASGATVRIIG